MRNPHRAFDVWWYWNEYLDPSDERLNPFVHYLLEGRRRGLAGLPEKTHAEPPIEPRRSRNRVEPACLLAMTSTGSLILTSLRTCGSWQPVRRRLLPRSVPYGRRRLAKLEGIVAGAWAVPHDRYDFGSYSMLAEELVGWEALEQYDEVLLVNDSSYLLRPLDDVFAAMAQRPCDWWGLQITSRWFDGDGPDRRPRPIEQVRHEFPATVMHPDESPHIGSYFLALRKPVIDDAGFRKRLDAVTSQRTKIRIIYKYETGTTQYLTGQGFGFDTYLDGLYPYHPMYSADTFDRISEGFPLLKRQLLSENPYDVPDLRNWKTRIVESVPDADVDMMEHNLLRVVPDNRLARSFAIVTRPDGTIDRPERLNRKRFRIADRKTPKFDHWWAFPVCAYDHTFAGNERAVFEEVRDDPSIKKIILTRSRRVEVTGENVVIVPIDSPEGDFHLLRSGQVFVKHGPSVNLSRRIDPKTHNVVNLWHGIPLKRFGLASAHFESTNRDAMIRNHGGSVP
ncbi:rhamnan synthesis F family protein [Aeromicrobium sp. UC242_57]|uniref:rhamnan synthesis F family protein n=1 Tax=Aeromicrobium sp. UC242_57 TaxID=3374624 RepID=UPI003798E9FA